MSSLEALLAPLQQSPDREAIRFGDRALDYRQLRGVGAAVAQQLEGSTRVAVWAEPTLETCVAVVGALIAGVAAVPINPKAGERELGHIVADSEPRLVLTAPDTKLPAQLQALERVDVGLDASSEQAPAMTAAPEALFRTPCHTPACWSPGRPRCRLPIMSG